MRAFIGKSPTPVCSPAGVSDQPVGSRTRPVFSPGNWATRSDEAKKSEAQLARRRMAGDFRYRRTTSAILGWNAMGKEAFHRDPQRVTEFHREKKKIIVTLCISV
jgi:hypothetical protein